MRIFRAVAAAFFGGTILEIWYPMLTDVSLIGKLIVTSLAIVGLLVAFWSNVPWVSQYRAQWPFRPPFVRKTQPTTKTYSVVEIPEDLVDCLPLTFKAVSPHFNVSPPYIDFAFTYFNASPSKISVLDELSGHVRLRDGQVCSGNVRLLEKFENISYLQKGSIRIRQWLDAAEVDEIKEFYGRHEKYDFDLGQLNLIVTSTEFPRRGIEYRLPLTGMSMQGGGGSDAT